MLLQLHSNDNAFGVLFKMLKRSLMRHAAFKFCFNRKINELFSFCFSIRKIKHNDFICFAHLIYNNINIFLFIFSAKFYYKDI